MKYVFVREFEDTVERIDSADLEEFRTFCHYSSLSDWRQHKRLIKKCLQESGGYELTGNDVKYYVYVLDY
jgi:hypothetical protein